MPFQPVPHGIEVNVRYARSGQFYGNNTFHFATIAENPTTAIVQDCVTNVVSWLTNSWANAYSSEVEITSVTGKGLDVAEAAYWAEDISIPGESVSPALPPNVTMALTQFTGTTGRSRRGRIFVCGLAENQVSGKYVLEAVVTDWITRAEELITELVGGDHTLAVLSRISGGVARAEGLLTPVEGYRAYDHLVDHMNTRLKA